MIVPQIIVTAVIITTAKMLIRKPVLIISIIFNFPVPKTIAFGGVAMGNINAIEAASVIGNINKRGFNFISVAKPDIIGSIISVVAVFDVNSVNNDIIPVKAATNIVGDRFPAPAKRPGAGLQPGADGIRQPRLLPPQSRLRRVLSGRVLPGQKKRRAGGSARHRQGALAHLHIHGHGSPDP